MMDNLVPIRPFMVIPGTGQRLRAEAMPMERAEYLRPVPVGFVRIPTRPTNDDQPNPPAAA